MQARIDAAAQRVPAAMRGSKVYFEVASAPFAAGEASFVGETLARLGELRQLNVAFTPLGDEAVAAFTKARPDVVVSR